MSLNARIASLIEELDRTALAEKTWTLRLASDSPIAPIAKTLTSGRGQTLFQNLLTLLREKHEGVTDQQVMIAINAVLSGIAASDE